MHTCVCSHTVRAVCGRRFVVSLVELNVDCARVYIRPSTSMCQRIHYLWNVCVTARLNCMFSTSLFTYMCLFVRACCAKGPVWPPMMTVRPRSNTAWISSETKHIWTPLSFSVRSQLMALSRKYKQHSSGHCVSLPSCFHRVLTLLSSIQQNVINNEKAQRRSFEWMFSVGKLTVIWLASDLESDELVVHL